MISQIRIKNEHHLRIWIANGFLKLKELKIIKILAVVYLNAEIVVEPNFVSVEIVNPDNFKILRFNQARKEKVIIT